MGSSLPDIILEEQRQKMICVAHDILDGTIGIIAGARELSRLRFCLSKEQDDSDLLVFVGIDSESDDLPLGDVRKHWNPEALKIKDEELMRFEMQVKEQAFKACERFIAKHERSSQV